MFFVWLLALISVSLASTKDEYNQERQYWPRKNPQEGGLELTDGISTNSCSTPKTVALFNKYFADEVRECELLTSVFNVANNATREEIKTALFYITSVFSEQKGNQKPTAEALNFSKNITPSCKMISPDIMLSIYSNAAGKRLNAEKKLCTNNAKVLAQTYARVTKDIAKKIAGENCPRSKIQSVIMGFNEFVSIQDIYIGDKGNTASIYSNEWSCQDKNVTACENCPIAWYSPEKPAFKPNDAICQMKNAAIDRFVNAFSEQVKNCKNLTNLFNVQPSVTPAMFSRGSYYLNLYFMGPKKIDRPRDLSDFMSRYIKDVKELKPRLVERVHSQFLGKYLFSEKVLNFENAESLAETYADIIRGKYMVIVDEKDARSKVVAMNVTWRNFLCSLNAISVKQVPNLAYTYGNEWRCQA